MYVVAYSRAGFACGSRALLADLAARGVAIVMVSSDLPEILGLSDRILVMREGRVMANLSRGEASEEQIMHYATGHAA
jgi:ABC-type sugar transport system ATPase subunit